MCGGCAVQCGLGVWCGISMQSEERGKVLCVVSCAVRCGIVVQCGIGVWCGMGVQSEERGKVPWWCRVPCDVVPPCRRAREGGVCCAGSLSLMPLLSCEMAKLVVCSADARAKLLSDCPNGPNGVWCPI